MREKEHATNEETIGDAQEAQTAVAQAVSVLKESGPSPATHAILKAVDLRLAFSRLRGSPVSFGFPHLLSYQLDCPEFESGRKVCLSGQRAKRSMSLAKPFY